LLSTQVINNRVFSFMLGATAHYNININMHINININININIT